MKSLTVPFKIEDLKLILNQDWPEWKFIKSITLSPNFHFIKFLPDGRMWASSDCPVCRQTVISSLTREDFLNGYDGEMCLSHFKLFNEKSREYHAENMALFIAGGMKC